MITKQNDMFLCNIITPGSVMFVKTRYKLLSSSSKIYKNDLTNVLIIRHSDLVLLIWFDRGGFYEETAIMPPKGMSVNNTAMKPVDFTKVTHVLIAVVT